MAIFIALSVASFIFYVFFKAKVFRTYQPMERNWVQSKSKMWLGSFIFFYGLNLLFGFTSKVAIIIGAVFVIVGLLYIVLNYRQYKIFRPLAVEERQKSS